MQNLSNIYVTQQPLDESNFKSAIKLANIQYNDIIYLTTKLEYKQNRHKLTQDLKNKILLKISNFTENDYMYIDGARDIHSYVFLYLALNKSHIKIKEIKPLKAENETVICWDLSNLII